MYIYTNMTGFFVDGKWQTTKMAYIRIRHGYEVVQDFAFPPDRTDMKKTPTGAVNPCEYIFRILYKSTGSSSYPNFQDLPVETF